MSYYREQLENWLKRIEVNASDVLDVGGMANPVKDRVKTFNVKNYKTLDNGAETLERPDYFYDVNYLVDLSMDFDVVFCLEVFEYIYNPVQAIENLGAFIRPGGLLYVSFPAIYPVHEPIDIDYLRYTKRAIEKLLPLGGFDRWEITPRVATIGVNELAKFYHSEGMHPVKGNSVIYDIGYMVKAWKGNGGEADV